MGKECDQPQIAALTDALGVRVQIEYLDGSTGAGEALQSYVCGPSDEQVGVYMLYRPGHYDVLYPRRSSSTNCSALDT
jgi:ubiquitin thioesterase protein OTUB1